MPSAGTTTRVATSGPWYGAGLALGEGEAEGEALAEALALGDGGVFGQVGTPGDGTGELDSSTDAVGETTTATAEGLGEAPGAPPARFAPTIATIATATSATPSAATNRGRAGDLMEPEW